MVYNTGDVSRIRLHAAVRGGACRKQCVGRAVFLVASHGRQVFAGGATCPEHWTTDNATAEELRIRLCGLSLWLLPLGWGLSNTVAMDIAWSVRTGQMLNVAKHTLTAIFVELAVMSDESPLVRLDVTVK